MNSFRCRSADQTLFETALPLPGQQSTIEQCRARSAVSRAGSSRARPRYLAHGASRALRLIGCQSGGAAAAAYVDRPQRIHLVKCGFRPDGDRWIRIGLWPRLYGRDGCSVRRLPRTCASSGGSPALRQWWGSARLLGMAQKTQSTRSSLIVFH